MPVHGYGKSLETTNSSSAVARTCHFFQIACALHAWMSHGVVAPESLVQYRPDVIILTNATYENEIKQQANRLGLDCEFLLA